MLWSWDVFSILTSNRAWRYSRARLFNTSTSKSALRLRCFYNFYIFLHRKVLCATGALFQHLNCQSWRFRAWFFLTFKSASRHNGVLFWSLIRPHGSAPATLASLYFRPSAATKHRKNTVFRDLSIIYLFDPFCAPLLLHLSISRKMTSRLLQSWLIHYFWTEHKGENDG